MSSNYCLRGNFYGPKAALRLTFTSKSHSLSLASLRFALAAPALGAILARVEGDVTDVPAKWLSIEQGITYENSTDIVPRAGTGGPRTDRVGHRRLVWQGHRHHGEQRANRLGWSKLLPGPLPLIDSLGAVQLRDLHRVRQWCSHQWSQAATLSSMEIATDSSAFPSMDAIPAEVNGKQGGYETDLCGQWRTDPGSNGSDV
ncbi:hypothetical protein B0H14DRAFT_2574593 [Mycena olivaceomarginata]|nr:hypothetical protein B0H14DRAFT_2574593 [Mycena olivaceomarginata]